MISMSLQEIFWTQYSRIHSVFELANIHFIAVLADTCQAGLLTPRSWFHNGDSYADVEHILNETISRRLYKFPVNFQDFQECYPTDILLLDPLKTLAHSGKDSWSLRFRFHDLTIVHLTNLFVVIIITISQQASW